MITKIQLYQGVIGYDYAMIRIWRYDTYKDYQYTSKRWNQLLRVAKRVRLWHWAIRPDGVDHTGII